MLSFGRFAGLLVHLRNLAGVRVFPHFAVVCPMKRPTATSVGLFAAGGGAAQIVRCSTSTNSTIGAPRRGSGAPGSRHWSCCRKRTTFRPAWTFAESNAGHGRADPRGHGRDAACTRSRPASERSRCGCGRRAQCCAEVTLDGMGKRELGAHLPARAQVEQGQHWRIRATRLCAARARSSPPGSSPEAPAPTCVDRATFTRVLHAAILRKRTVRSVQIRQSPAAGRRSSCRRRRRSSGP